MVGGGAEGGVQRGLCSPWDFLRLIYSGSWPGGAQWLPHTWDLMCRARPAVPLRRWADALQHEQHPHSPAAWPLAQLPLPLTPVTAGMAPSMSENLFPVGFTDLCQ